ncbi:hypothetical protein GGI21_005201, partial [Coemansia aciculifera]
MALYYWLYSEIAEFISLRGFTPHVWLLPAAAAASALAAVIYVIYCLYFAPLSKIPGCTLSKLTQAKMYFESFLCIWADVSIEDYFTYGDIYTIGPNAVVISNPADCRAVFSAHHRFIKGEMYEAFSLIEDSIFTTRSAKLADMRHKQLGPAFTHSSVKAMEPVIIECGILAIKAKWDKAISESPTADGRTTVCYGQHFAIVPLDIIGALAFGERFNALRDDTTVVVDWVKDGNKLSVARMLSKKLPFFPIDLLTRDLIKRKDEFVAYTFAAADKRRNQLMRGEIEKPKDLLQILVDSQDPDSKIRLTDSQIASECLNIFLGGTDTTSITLSWTMHYLTLYPDIYRKATNEARSNFPRHHTITYAEAKERLPYVEACLYEGLRIRAASGFPIPRLVTKGGATFQGHFLPEGTEVYVSIPGLNYNQSTWKNPRRFMPERFIEDERAYLNFMTFVSGPRACPG